MTEDPKSHLVVLGEHHSRERMLSFSFEKEVEPLKAIEVVYGLKKGIK